MAWVDTARDLVLAFEQVKKPPFSFPHRWVRSADADTYTALANLHAILSPPTLTLPPLSYWFTFSLLPPNCPHPTSAAPHPFPVHGPNFLYTAPTVAYLAWRLAQELNGVAIPPNHPDLQKVLTYVRDAADCN